MSVTPTGRGGHSWQEAWGKLAVGHASRAAAPDLRVAERELNAVYVEAIAAAGTAGRAAAEAVAASRRLQADACVRVDVLVAATATYRTRGAEVEIALRARCWASSGSRRRRRAETTRPLATVGLLEESVLVRVHRKACRWLGPLLDQSPDDECTAVVVRGVADGRALVARRRAVHLHCELLAAIGALLEGVSKE